jgi:hypothetical protein
MPPKVDTVVADETGEMTTGPGQTGDGSGTTEFERACVNNEAALVDAPSRGAFSHVSTESLSSSVVTLGYIFGVLVIVQGFTVLDLAPWYGAIAVAVGALVIYGLSASPGRVQP